jgi:RNA polymerase sigma factor (sigma-70 family)
MLGSRAAINRKNPPSTIRPQWLLHLAQRKIRFHFDNVRKRDTLTNCRLKELSTISPSELSLLVRVAINDVGAMEQCIHQYSNLVWNLVKRRVASHATAEDLVQEIFTDIWKSASRFDPAHGNEATFIGMIARRRVIDWTRKQMRSPVLEPLPDVIDDLGAAEEGKSNSAVDGEMVSQAVAKLPDQTRQLFHLHFDQGLTQQEIASYTELPLGTVKTLLRRGLLELRSLLSPRNPASTNVPD